MGDLVDSEADMTDWNPVSVANAIRDVVDRLEKSSKVIAEAYDAYLTAKRAYTLALAEKKQEFQGTPTERTDKALPFCQQLWLEMDEADVAYKYAQDLADALEKKLSGLQTEARLMTQEMVMSR
jgi:hypothetical protein